MKAPITLSVCKSCGRDLVGSACSFCDIKIDAPRPIPPGVRAFRCVQRHEGLGMYEIAEILGDTSEQALVNLSALLYRLCRLGALRSEGGRNERTYFAADETKVPNRLASVPQETRAPRKPSSERLKAKAKARRERLAAEGLCTWCGKERQHEGRSRCMPCIEKGRESHWLYVTSQHGHKRQIKRLRRRYKRNRKFNLQEKRELYAFYKERGICVSCHSADASVGANCPKCAERRAEASKLRMRRLYTERLAAGICVRCGKTSAVSGGTACQPCRDKVTTRKRKAGK